jgi:hypothetical protein
MEEEGRREEEEEREAGQVMSLTCGTHELILDGLLHMMFGKGF